VLLDGSVLGISSVELTSLQSQRRSVGQLIVRQSVESFAWLDDYWTWVFVTQDARSTSRPDQHCTRQTDRQCKHTTLNALQLTAVVCIHLRLSLLLLINTLTWLDLTWGEPFKATRPQNGKTSYLLTVVDEILRKSKKNFPCNAFFPVC